MQSPRIIKNSSIAALWEESISLVLAEGEWSNTERGLQAIEACNLILHVPVVSMPIVVSDKYQFSSDFIDHYEKSLQNDFTGISVSDRLFNYGDKGINQLTQVLNRLKEFRSSRRAVATLWNPIVDGDVEHPPCNVAHQFLIRGDTLHLTSIFRSNDAWMAALPDMIANCNLLRRIADELDVFSISYTHIATSYHIYESDFSIALSALHE